MKRHIVTTLIGIACLAVLALALQPAVAGPVEDAAARGAKLFADSGLGTNGKSCDSCHSDLGKGGNPLTGRSPFPKVFSMAGKVRTMDQAIQQCVTGALNGPALAWDDEKLSDLAAYMDSLYRAK